MVETKRSVPKTDKHVWIVYQSYSGEWRWEERDENSRVVCESSRGFMSRAECLHDAALHGKDLPAQGLH